MYVHFGEIKKISFPPCLSYKNLFEIFSGSALLIIFYVRSCTTDEELRQVLMKDDILNILSFLGYRGVPSKETLSSKEAILR